MYCFCDYVAAVYMANCIFNKPKNKVDRSTNRSLMKIYELQMKKHELRSLESPEVQCKSKFVRANHLGQRLAS